MNSKWSMSQFLLYKSCPLFALCYCIVHHPIWQKKCRKSKSLSLLDISISKQKINGLPFPFLSLFLEIFSAAKTISPKSDSMITSFPGVFFAVLQAWIKRRPPSAASFFFVALSLYVYTSDLCSSISTIRIFHIYT